MTSKFSFMTSPTRIYHMTQILLQIWSCDQNVVILVMVIVMVTMTKVMITSILQGFDQRNQFFVGVALFQAQQFGTATSYGLKILQQCDKRVKAKIHKVLRANSYVRGE